MTERFGADASAGMRGTRLLLAIVIGLGALIVAATTVVVVTLVHRAFVPSRPAPVAAAVGSTGRVNLDEPPGTRIGSVSVAGGRLALLLVGGGLPDRVVLLDPADGGRMVGTVDLGGAPGPAR